ncbi:MAG: hypothetical protein KGR98_00615 [Verrucomicrobia bacterium]|nr:hypothetical protein [Verrucomicrobiota bacterium]MDE3097903.1 hypothetical protein [Verrucomicrobiota bacterium]
MSALVCFALKEEAAPFQKMAAAKSGVSVLITGIGRDNAEKSLRNYLASHSPGLVLTCGFAGGLDPALKLGDIIFEAPAPLPDSCASLPHSLAAAGAKPAKILCANRIATTVDERRTLRMQTGADAAEMESGAIHAVCRGRGIPAVTVRVISDTALEALPLDFNRFLTADKTLDLKKLLGAVAMSPGKIGALMKLQRQAAFAAGRLAETLFKVLQTPID